MIARTQGHPPVHYHRKWVDSSLLDGVGEGRPGDHHDHLLPLVWNGKQYLFWAITNVKPDKATTRHGRPRRRDIHADRPQTAPRSAARVEPVQAGQVAAQADRPADSRLPRRLAIARHNLEVLAGPGRAAGGRVPQGRPPRQHGRLQHRVPPTGAHTWAPIFSAGWAAALRRFLQLTTSRASEVWGRASPRSGSSGC